MFKALVNWRRYQIRLTDFDLTSYSVTLGKCIIKYVSNKNDFSVKTQTNVNKSISDEISGEISSVNVFVFQLVRVLCSGDQSFSVGAGFGDVVEMSA